MSTIYSPKVRKTFIISLLAIFCLIPLQASAVSILEVNTVENEVTTTVSNETETEANTTQITKEKKKDKVQINKYFYLNLLIDLVAVLLIISFIYYPNYKKLDTIFTFIMFNVVIFVLTFVLNEVKISMGAAFGLFAVFSMLRYRTAGIGMKDMTYLFIFIALGLVSAIQLEYYELLIICFIVFMAALLLDTKILLKKESSGTLRFEKIDLIKPEKRTELIEELKKRTGLNIHRVTINEIDFLKDTANISYYYYD